MIFFTPFFIVSAVDFEQTNVCWIPPYELINAEITNCCNYLQVYQNLSETEAHKRMWSKVDSSCSKKGFFSF